MTHHENASQEEEGGDERDGGDAVGEQAHDDAGVRHADGQAAEGQEEGKVTPAKPTLTVGQVIAKACADLTSGVYISGLAQVMEVARQNDKRPAYIKFAVPDDHALNISGEAKLSDWYFAIRVPREFVDRVTPPLATPIPTET